MSRLLVRDSRHISLARALHVRLYMNCEGRLFAVSGAAAYDKLRQALERQDRIPTAAEAPTPHDLGVPTCDGELSQPLLHSIGHGLHRWRKQLTAEMRRRPGRRRQSADLAAELREIDTLAARLSAVRQWQSQFAAGAEPPGAPFFLDSAAEASLQVALRDAQQTARLPAAVAWQARVVCWLAGECALRRFLSTTTGVLGAYPKAIGRAKLRGFAQALIAWKHRSGREQVCNLRAEMSQHIQRLPPEIVRQAKLSSRLGSHTFVEHCDLLLQRCNRLLAKRHLQCWHILPAALAALAATDGSTVALPQRCFRECAETENFALLAARIGKLAAQIGQPGYDALLAVIDQLPETPDHLEYGQLRQLLAQGISLADALWACQHQLLGSLSESCLSVAAVRRLDERFADRGFALHRYELDILVRGIRQPEQLVPILVWLNWLTAVSPRAITPRMKNVLRAAFWDRYLPSVRQAGWFDRIATCLAPLRRLKGPDDSASLLARIAEYQRFAGKRQAVPKSLRKLLESQDRRQRECDGLRARLTAGTLDPAARSRLDWLENDRGAPPQAAKIRRAAEEVFLRLGIETLVAVTHELADARCREHLGDLAALVARDQLWDFALWIDKMDEPQRQQLREVVAARSADGQEYKRSLAENQEWIAQALAAGVDLGPWFAAEVRVEIIAGRPVEIVLASDLQNIFLMGEYFHTCLSLGGCNEMSVLANAYDANKQVVFMFAADEAGQRHVLARQLIAISHDFELIGYRFYASVRHVDKPDRPEYLDAMAAYCGRLAAACGLELADQGSPAEIGNHFWYDDGELQWPAAARAACADAAGQQDVLAASAC